MKLSIILPAYNEEKNLPKVIGALRKQAEKEVEIIVVDNNSTDNTFKVAKKLADKVYKCTDQGISPARNCGAKKAKSELIAFLDSDCIPSERWIKTIKESFENDPKLTVMSGLDLYEYDSIPKRLFLNFFAYLAFYYCKFATALGKEMIFANNLAIKRKVFNKVGGFDKFIVEDVLFSMKLRKQKNVKCKMDKKMKIECSSRRIRKIGIIKTYYIWVLSSFKKIPADQYGLHDKL